MDFRYCKQCRKAFSSFGNALCPSCVRYLDECFVKARDYLDENPGASIQMLVEDTEIDEKIVLSFLREGRLALRVATEGLLTCSKCGIPVLSGMYCPACAQQLSRTLSSVLPQNARKYEAQSKYENQSKHENQSKRARGAGMHTKRRIE